MNWLKKLNVWHIITINLIYLIIGFQAFNYFGIYSAWTIFVMILPIILFDIKWRNTNEITNGLIFGKQQYVNLAIAVIIIFCLVWMLMLGL